jgi:hypothetical protein
MTNHLLREELEKMYELSGIEEETERQEAYQKFFNAKLKEFGADSPSDLSDEDKVKFFNAIDDGWDAETE